MKALDTPNPKSEQFLGHTRLSPGRADFVVWLTEARDEAVRIAIYGSDDRMRAVNAGRAQALTELVNLFARK